MLVAPLSFARLMYTSLQIIFAYGQVICQARGQFWPDKKPVWSDKNANQYEEIKLVSERVIYWLIWTPAFQFC